MLRFEPISSRALLQPMPTLEHKFHFSYIKRSPLVEINTKTTFKQIKEFRATFEQRSQIF